MANEKALAVENGNIQQMVVEALNGGGFSLHCNGKTFTCSESPLANCIFPMLQELFQMIDSNEKDLEEFKALINGVELT